MAAVARHLVRPRFNALLETLFVRAENVFGPGRTGWDSQLLLNPGIRWAYNFPSGLTGKGQEIGIIELGGGFRPAELEEYFMQIGEGEAVNKRKHLAAWWERVSNRPTWRRVARTGPQPYDDGVTADVAPRDLQRLRAHVGRPHLGVRRVVGNRDRDAPAAGADVRDA